MSYVKKKTKNGKIVKLKNYKRRAKINRIKRKLFLIIFLLIILIIILLFAPFMQIKNINCSGNKTISAEDIISASKIHSGDNIFRINKHKSIDSINDNPYIKNVTIDRKLPSTINIIVDECKVRAYIEKNKEYVFVDEKGKVLEISKKIPDEKVPVITGINITKCNENEIVEFKNKNQIQCLNNILETIVSSKFDGMVTTINLKNTEKLSITLNDNLEIILGSAEDLDYKINFMAAGAYDSLGDTHSGILDVSYGSKAVYKEKH